MQQHLQSSPHVEMKSELKLTSPKASEHNKKATLITATAKIFEEKMVWN